MLERKIKKGPMLNRSKIVIALAYIVSILTSLFFIGPIIGLFVMSIKPQAIIELPVFNFVPTLHNYENLFFRNVHGRGVVSTKFISSLINSLFISGITTLSIVILAALSSYAFSRFRFKGRFALGLYIFVCYSVPAIAYLYPLHFILINLHLYDTHLGIIFVHVILGLPWTIWMLKSFFDSVPKELEESGMVDGCSRFEAFTRIILPVSAPGLVVVSIFTFIFVWNSFLPMIILSGEKTKPLIVFLLENRGWGTLAPACIVTMVPTIVLALLIQKYVIRGITLGSVKY
ncbi:MAG: carbohydrate ABC transporter permease [Candidatus Bathyarchaeia archaeon]